MKPYTEKQVLDAWDAAMFGTGGLPRDRFVKALKGEPVLYSKKDLLEAAGSNWYKILVHAVFGVLGTELANEEALVGQASELNYGFAMQDIISHAKRAKKESLGPGQVVRDAEGTWAQWDGHGFLKFGSSLHWTSDILKRPLEKM